MKFHLFFLLLVIFTGCASYHKPAQKPRPPQEVSTKKEVLRVRPSVTGGAVWELLSDRQVTLMFKDIDTGKNLSVIAEEGVSVKAVPPGHWELTGFEKEGRTFVSMNTAKKFVFRMKPKSNTYAGTYLISCPAVSEKDYKFLKKLKFYNRYPFSSDKGLCEVAVGSDYLSVRTKFRQKMKNLKLSLHTGF